MQVTDSHQGFGKTSKDRKLETAVCSVSSVTNSVSMVTKACIVVFGWKCRQVSPRLNILTSAEFVSQLGLVLLSLGQIFNIRVLL